MKKIAKVISECKDCPHFVKATTKPSLNSFQVAICGFQPEDEDRTEEFYSLLLYVPEDSVHQYNIKIPDSCPLETYKP